MEMLYNLIVVLLIQLPSLLNNQIVHLKGWILFYVNYTLSWYQMKTRDR